MFRIFIQKSILRKETEYLINFTQPRKRFLLSLHYNGRNSFIFVNATKIYQFKVKDAEKKDYKLCLGNISKDSAINNMEKNRIKRKPKIFFCWI